eukprot:scaffold3165_cov380-Prasinococcus_capsulatus_cf.AAC.7
MILRSQCSILFTEVGGAAARCTSLWTGPHTVLERRQKREGAMWDWEIREWEEKMGRRYPRGFPKTNRPLDTFRTLGHLLDHTEQVHASKLRTRSLLQLGSGPRAVLL